MSDTPRAAANVWVLFLAGPVIWSLHFVSVYVVAEAVCATGGFDARVVGLRVLSFITVAATLIAVAAIAFFAAHAWRRWRDGHVASGTGAPRDEPGPADEVGHNETVLALGGVLLGAVFFVAVLFVGVPALFLQSC